MVGGKVRTGRKSRQYVVSLSVDDKIQCMTAAMRRERDVLFQSGWFQQITERRRIDIVRNIHVEV